MIVKEEAAVPCTRDEIELSPRSFVFGEASCAARGEKVVILRAWAGITPI